MEKIGRILIVDDDETSIFLTRRLLNTLGIGSNVRTAHDGVGGLAILKDALEKGELPQLILVDINMHGMGGFAFLEELGKLRYVNLIDTKIVLLSGSQSPLDIELAERHLSATLVQKPLTRDKLLSVLD
ncbi:response regulator [Pontibacter locisalis]|uniref:Response regulator n=1 Tax=Pontibacter locisalis TaxID=1719035 RepID=A0ABW5IPB8_9BACT